MKQFRSLFTFFFLFSCTFIDAKTSVIIPCYHVHTRYLKPLLHELSKQTSLPDEVVISISEADKVKPGLIDGLEECSWPFELIIVQTNLQKSAGENRNIAAESSSGDLLICQDADDLPHPQRVEIIEYFFENHEMDYLMHYCSRPKPGENLISCFSEYKQHTFVYNRLVHRQLPKNQLSRVKFRQSVYVFLNRSHFVRKIQKIPKLGTLYCAHFGNCALTRKVFDTVKWTKLNRGQDVEFCQKVCNKFRNACIMNAPLVLYVQERTSLQYLNPQRCHHGFKSGSLEFVLAINFPQGDTE